MNKQRKNRRSVRSKIPSVYFWRWNYNKLKLWQSIVIALTLFVMLFTAANYAVAYWYQQQHKNEPLVIGTTFVAKYARYFGLDPQATMQAMIDEVGFRQFRLVSYWDEIEAKQGIYDFSDLDWQFKKVEDAGGKVSLAIGLRQPRWPECHMPTWAAQMPMSQWEPRLNDFVKAVIERYKDSSALESYQLENEFFLDVFGECPDFSRERLVREYEYVKTLDNKPVIISRSNNAIGIPLGKPLPDQTAVSVYKRVWDKTITKRYFEYPLPPWFYSSLAGTGELLTGKSMIIHEMQMEAWLPDNGGYAMNDVRSLDEQYKSMNAERLEDRFDYANATGIRTIYTWGAEWWYWHKVVAQDPSMWEVAKKEVAEANRLNQENHTR